MSRKVQPEFYEQKAHLTRELKFLLIDHFLFRAFFQFKDRKKFTAYGNEHRCTYNQVLAGRVKTIELDREKGYTDLVKLVETSYKGKYQRAAIYMRSEETNDFDITCRLYDSHGLIDIQDPVLTEAQKIKTLYPSIQNNRIIICTEPVQLPDFKTILNQKLNEQ